jgi:hypothetical protein
LLPPRPPSPGCACAGCALAGRRAPAAPPAPSACGAHDARGRKRPHGNVGQRPGLTPGPCAQPHRLGGAGRGGRCAAGRGVWGVAQREPVWRGQHPAPCPSDAQFEMEGILLFPRTRSALAGAWPVAVYGCVVRGWWGVVVVAAWQHKSKRSPVTQMRSDTSRISQPQWSGAIWRCLRCMHVFRGGWLWMCKCSCASMRGWLAGWQGGVGGGFR